MTKMIWGYFSTSPAGRELRTAPAGRRLGGRVTNLSSWS